MLAELMTLVMTVNASHPMMLEIPLALAKLEKCWQRQGRGDKLCLMACTEWMNPAWIVAIPGESWLRKIQN